MNFEFTTREFEFLLGKVSGTGRNIRPNAESLTGLESLDLVARMGAHLEDMKKMDLEPIPAPPADPRDSRIADLERQLAEQSERANKADRDGVYWYRRAEFAETALEEFVTHEKSWSEAITGAQLSAPLPSAPDEDEPGYWKHELRALESAMAGANVVLAERRKQADDFRNFNFEDYIRDRRQKKIFDWAMRTFGDTEPLTGHPTERAFRFLEEALELWQAAVNSQVMVDTNGAVSFQCEREEQVSVAYCHRAMFPYMQRFWKLFTRVMMNQPGRIHQEIGGTMVTLLAYGQAVDVSVAACEKAEFERVLTIPKEENEARHQKKVDAGF